MTAILTLDGDHELRSRLVPLATREAEFVNVSRDLDTWPDAREGARQRALQGKAGRSRKLFSPAVLADERDRRLLREMTERGFKVRITTAPLPQGTVFIGRQAMILTEPQDPGGGRRRYTMSTAAGLVSAAYALFEAAWETAAEVESFLVSGDLRADASARAILRALGSGITDETAARQLGVSVRTYRRRVAELLTALGADSRFQAGIRAGELGLTRD